MGLWLRTIEKRIFLLECIYPTGKELSGKFLSGDSITIAKFENSEDTLAVCEDIWQKIEECILNHQEPYFDLCKNQKTLTK